MEYRLDIGCGPNKRDGFLGIDQYSMNGVDAICDLSMPEWWLNNELIPNCSQRTNNNQVEYLLPENSIDEVFCSHFLEHLTALQRVCFMNELFRILKPGAKATIITPHWASNRAYGDFTHQWPPVSEMYYYYLSAEWRASQAPHTDFIWNKAGYKCNFQASWAYFIRPDIAEKDTDFQQNAMQHYKEVILDMCSTIIAIKT